MRNCGLLALISCLIVLSAGLSLSLAEPPEPVPAYVGTETCATCHADAAADWRKSHHANAWNRPTDKTVLGDFDETSFTHRGLTSRLFRRGEKYFMTTEGPDGQLAEFQVKYTVGITPLQQYLLETEPGRLQAADIVWDTIKKRWYHLYPEQDLKGGDGLHWTGPYKTWNARCAECHATDYSKAYSGRTKRYSSRQAEIGVGCEACHGPGEAHVAWAKNTPGDGGRSPLARWSGLTGKGFTIGFSPKSAQTEVQQCAMCHARREPLGDRSPLPGTPFHDVHRLTLLRPGAYHVDGTIQDEVFVYGSFLQSKMHQQGVRCTDCHMPHTAELKTEGNGVCTQCHSPASNPRFSSLRKAEYDDPAHHFHAPESAGAQCKSCHMVERVYMGVDGRRDHSFRVPRPDVSVATGAPNTCNDCHTDRDAKWAADEIAKRFPNSKHRGSHFAAIFAQADRDPTEATDGLLALAEDTATPGIVRASALNRLVPIANPSIAERVTPLLRDADALVRTAAADLQRGSPPAVRVTRLLPALEDDRRVVRITAARALLGVPGLQRLPSREAAAVRRANGEWQASLIAKLDFPETHIVIGGTALVLRNPRAAEQAFREAVRQDPQLVQGWRMIARIRAAYNDRAGARAAIDAGLRANEGNAVLLGLRRDLLGAR